MLLKIIHRTSYHYSQPVFLEPFTVRLRPRSDASQTLRSYSITVTPNPSGISHCIELYGNNSETIWFSGLHENLLIEVHTLVETHHGNPFDFFVTDQAALTLPLEYQPQFARVLDHYLVREAGDSGLAAFAQEMLREAKHETIPFLNLLAEQIYQRLEYMLREQGDPWTACETLKLGKGSCRDFAILFIDICRSVGIAARFVSGYCVGDDSAGGDMHAWAEVYLPGAGWRGFDPSRGLSVNDDYIAVAAGQLSRDAAPTFGSFRGEAVSSMDANISVSVLDSKISV
ncbi:MAG: transglutaminase family protein [Gallionella sp.]